MESLVLGRLPGLASAWHEVKVARAARLMPTSKLLRQLAGCLNIRQKKHHRNKGTRSTAPKEQKNPPAKEWSMCVCISTHAQSPRNFGWLTRIIRSELICFFSCRTSILIQQCSSHDSSWSFTESLDSDLLHQKLKMSNFKQFSFIQNAVFLSESLASKTVSNETTSKGSGVGVGQSITLSLRKLSEEKSWDSAAVPPAHRILYCRSKQKKDWRTNVQAG